jgi:hypothetical protein
MVPDILYKDYVDQMKLSRAAAWKPVIKAKFQENPSQKTNRNYGVNIQP